MGNYSTKLIKSSAPADSVKFYHSEPRNYTSERRKSIAKRKRASELAEFYIKLTQEAGL